MTNEEIKQFWSKAVSYARSKGLQNDAEDFAQEACLEIIGGRKAGLRFLLIDYLRRRYGRSRERGLTPKFFEQRYWMPIDKPDEAGTPFHQPAGDIGGQPEFERGDWLSRIDIYGRESEIFDLIVIDGMKEAEVGEDFGITESRVSQVMKVVREKTKDAMILSETLDRYKDEKEYSQLEIEWITL